MSTARPQTAKKTRELARRGRALLAPPPGLRRADMIAMGCIMACCFFLFQFGDLDITASFSYAYLDGHFFDFYRYNKATLASAFVIDIDYLQPIYLLLAAWNVPMKLLGLTGHAAQGIYKLSAVELAWNKLLLVLFLALCCVTVYKIARLITQEDKPAKLCMFLFAASPLTVFAVFIFGGYDIFGLTFMMLGLHAFLRHEHWRFILWFALAIPFKYFAIFPFLPLLLLDEKNVWKILRGLGLVAAPSLVCLALTLLDSSSTEGEALRQLGSLQLRKANLGPITTPALFSLGYLAICLFAHFKRPGGDRRERQKYAVMLSLAAITSIFFFVKWNMQWIILMAPLLALAFLFSPNKKTTLLFETVGSTALFLRIFYIYSLVIPPDWDNLLLDPGKWDLHHRVYFLGNFWVTFPPGYGPVRGFFQPGIMSISKFVPDWILPYIDLIILVCLLAPFALLFLYRKKEVQPAPALTKAEAGILRLRCYGGLAAYLLPIAVVSGLYAWVPALLEKITAIIGSSIA